jgi:hypothetical protein
MSGLVRRSQITATLTIRNANSVPMLTSLAIAESGRKAAISPIGTAKSTVRMTGAWVRLQIEPRRLGKRPSRHIE